MDLDGDAVPATTETPAAAEDLAVATAPETPSQPAAPAETVEAPLAGLDAPAGAAAPDQPGLLLAEVAPAPADLPGPPPLTPEEEALLREIAEDGPGTALPSGLVPEAAPEAPSEPPVAGEAPPEDQILQPGGESSTLPTVPALSGDAEGVTTGRLPRIGDAAVDPAAAAKDAADDRPLAAFARPFDNPEAKPAFAIVLMDDGDEAIDRAALAALPFPVSFALDPAHPKAADHAAIYRAAGQEVVLLASGLPKGAVAADVEVAMEAMARALPETVAVMELPETAFQGDRPLAAR